MGVDGTVHVATNGGLGVFDGSAWSTLFPPQPLPFSVTAVASAPNGDLWLGTSGGLARRRQSGAWTVFTTANSGLPANPVNDVVVGADGSVWVGTFDVLNWPYPGGVSRFDGTTWTTWTKDDSPLPHNQVTDLAFDHQGNLWVAAASEAVAVILDAVPSPVVDLGGGLAGVAGVPALAIQGSLVPGSPVSLSLSGGPAAGVAHLAIGLSRVDVPFKGGVLVPSPDAVLAGLPLDGAGSLAVSSTWPHGLPSGVPTWWQAWLPDAAAVKGWSASNALQLAQP